MTAERVVVINDSSVARGGGTALAMRLACDLEARGLDVVLLCGDNGAGSPVRRTHGFGGTRLDAAGPSSAFRNLWNRDAARFVADCIAREDTPRTVYHVHVWQQIFSPALFHALRPVWSRVLLHAHDFFLACPTGSFFDFPRSAVCDRAPLSASCLACRCDKRSSLHKAFATVRAFARRLAWPAGAHPLVAMIHPGQAPYLLRGGAPADRLRLLRNPVDFFDPDLPDDVAARDDVLFVGRLAPEKGVDLLADACAMVGRRLIVVGEGPVGETLRERPEVELLGWRDRAGVRAAMGRAGLLAFPSRHPDPFGLVVVEALSAGLPVVLPSHVLLGTEVASGGAGETFRGGDVADLARALSVVRGRPAMEMSALAPGQARRSASSARDWVDACISLYGELTARPDVAAPS